MDDQFSGAGGDFGIGYRHAYGPTVPRLTAHPTVLADRGPRLRPAGDHDAAPADQPVDHLFPNGSLRPTSVIFALCVVPATVALTRHVDGQPAVWARRVALVTAAVV